MSIGNTTKASAGFPQTPAEEPRALFESQLDHVDQRSPIPSPRQHIEKKLGEVKHQISANSLGAYDSNITGLSQSHARRNHRLTYIAQKQVKN